jgi:hypothetical protein
MNTNWPKVVKEFRTIMLSHVKIYNNGKLDDKAMRDLKFDMDVTDNYHPWNSDGELSRSLDRMPEHCNYRSVDSYWNWKNGKSYIEDALYNVLNEMQDIIQDTLTNEWNFEPGYKMPEQIIFPTDWSTISTKSVGRIIRAAKS